MTLLTPCLQGVSSCVRLLITCSLLPYIFKRRMCSGCARAAACLAFRHSSNCLGALGLVIHGLSRDSPSSSHAARLHQWCSIVQQPGKRAKQLDAESPSRAADNKSQWTYARYLVYNLRYVVNDVDNVVDRRTARRCQLEL